jgi:hypothetical protein
MKKFIFVLIAIAILLSACTTHWTVYKVTCGDIPTFYVAHNEWGGEDRIYPSGERAYTPSKGCLWVETDLDFEPQK